MWVPVAVMAGLPANGYTLYFTFTFTSGSCVKMSSRLPFHGRHANEVQWGHSVPIIGDKWLFEAGRGGALHHILTTCESANSHATLSSSVWCICLYSRQQRIIERMGKAVADSKSYHFSRRSYWRHSPDLGRMRLTVLNGLTAVAGAHGHQQGSR